MSKMLSAILLLSMVAALPFSCLAVVSTSAEQAIMALDVCGPDSPYGVDAAPALTEPVNVLLTLSPSSYTPAAEPHAGAFVFAVSIDKPPVA